MTTPEIYAKWNYVFQIDRTTQREKFLLIWARLVSHPKFYFFDVGLYRTLRPIGPLDMPEEVGGGMLSRRSFCKN